MKDKTGTKWSREETILAFELYCRTPFSKITKNNKDIIELARMLGRTPSSVGLKMANLAHFDPEIKKRNLSGMSHGSRLDKEICEEFANDWEALYLESQKILAEIKDVSLEEMVDIKQELSLIPKGEYHDAQVKVRLGQYFFRTVVLNSYSNSCCIDRGLITLNNNYEIIISSKLKSTYMDENTKQWLMKYDHKRIILPDKFLPDKKFIEYHNEMIFQY